MCSHKLPIKSLLLDDIHPIIEFVTQQTMLMTRLVASNEAVSSLLLPVVVTILIAFFFNVCQTRRCVGRHSGRDGNGVELESDRRWIPMGVM